ncbi:MAG: hypothetical protein BGO55_29360 [Sphingobacteriales bacterium 50-39]|nr:hypothetical protein [Sphingobacteriales bacterium]OJW60649.1 MAG: hypothetical protein BGO55_29360 [Sphingobacteriales bacterium 50-39]
MKKTIKIRLAAVALLCALYSLVSCRKENLNGNSRTTDSSAVFSAMINGVEWKTDSVSAFLVGDYRDHSKVMAITAYTSQKAISINLQDTTTTGNDSSMTVQQYALGGWGDASAFAYANGKIQVGRNLVWQQQGEAVSGVANVTVSDGVNKRISGTFQFNARVLSIDSTGLAIDSVTVTAGVFKNIPYSYLKHP